jgi:phosphatidylserine/phosphatidylglycerophosphate/cardiolipin synthase-like enzyme
MLLFSEDFTKELTSCIANTSSELVICSAFVKEKAITHLLKNISSDVAVTIVARWAKQDLTFGASDLGVYTWCQNNGYRFGVNSSLHAKLYLVDQSLIFLGSANLTHRGLSISGKGNVEIGTRMDPSATDIQKFKSFVNNEVVWVDDDIFNRLEAEVNLSKDINKESKNLDWSKDINEMFKRKVSHLWVSELLFTSPKRLQNPNFESPEIVHDFELLNLTIDNFNEDSLKQAFLETRMYRWLRDTIGVDNEVRFGWLTKQLHSALLDDSTPYRSDVKEFIVTIFEWFKFMPEIFEVKKFNVSESVLIKG